MGEIHRGYPQTSRSQEDPDRSLAHLWLSRENRSDSIVGRTAWVERPIRFRPVGGV